jgi:hypothetical protein
LGCFYSISTDHEFIAPVTQEASNAIRFVIVINAEILFKCFSGFFTDSALVAMLGNKFFPKDINFLD